MLRKGTRPYYVLCVIAALCMLVGGFAEHAWGGPGYLEPVPAPGHPPANNHHPADTCNPNYIAECRSSPCIDYTEQLCFDVLVSIGGGVGLVHICLTVHGSYKFVSSGVHWPRCYLKSVPKEPDCWYHWKACGYWVDYYRPACASPGTLLAYGYIEGCDPQAGGPGTPSD